MLKLGVHVSIAGKIYNSIDRAKSLGCNTMQIFARSPRQFRKAALSGEDIEIFKEKAAKEKIAPVAIHIPYTLNLAASKEKFHRITIREFATDLLEADRLGADYLITHMGSYKGSTEDEGIEKIALALEKILEKTEGAKTAVLLENTSGSGRWLGHRFSQHRTILENLKWTKRVGICLDTAHAWAAGYKIDEAEGLDALLNEIDDEIGVERLKVIHLNDTQEKLASRRDRHFHIGKGSIGKKGFRLILNHPRLRGLPFILETPKKSEGEDVKNLDAVRKLYKDVQPR